VDYRSKKRVRLDESEWVMYPDPNIPAIVPEELWDRANALYRQRSKQMKARQASAGFHNRYPYSGKIVCEAHGTSFHRHVLKSAGGKKEVWQCRVYRQRGRAGCAAPQLRAAELDEVMARLFDRLVLDKGVIVDMVAEAVRAVPDVHNYGRDIARLEAEIARLRAKKDRLLEMSIAEAIAIAEFKARNEGFNEQIRLLEVKQAALAREQKKSALTADALQEIRAALAQELSFEHGIHSAVVASILDRVLVRESSTSQEIDLSIRLKFGGPCEASFVREKSSFRLVRF
ncbi:MAG: recombinase family protein, partial [Clostridiales bacterium]|nr:recombinase family protein [Clostridiales bacterium]